MTQSTATAPSSGATRTAAATPILMTSPTAGPVSSVWSEAATTTNTAMPVDRAAATGAPIASATPTTRASTRDPTAVGASPAPSNARAGMAMSAIAMGTVRGLPAASGARIPAIVATPPRRTAASSAPRRAVRMAASRRPDGSGRQLGDHGFAGPIAEMYPPAPPSRPPSVPRGTRGCLPSRGRRPVRCPREHAATRADRA
jgi:hypothetical protein